MNQEELFEAWRSLESSVNLVGNYVQNDLDKLIHDGHITKRDIAKYRSDFNKGILSISEQLRILYLETDALLSKYS